MTGVQDVLRHKTHASPLIKPCAANRTSRVTNFTFKSELNFLALRDKKKRKAREEERWKNVSLNESAQKKRESACNPVTSSGHDTLGQWRKRRRKAHKLQSDINEPNNESTLPGKPHRNGDLSVITLFSYLCLLVTAVRVWGSKSQTPPFCFVAD